MPDHLSPLPDGFIRLLLLQPGSWDSPLIGTLSLVELGSHGYNAISYVWGNPKLTGEIVLNGVPTYLTLNLEMALRTVRDQNRDIVLWADALCINQYDVEEKNRQVDMMFGIYANADAVIAYLGTGADPVTSIETYSPKILHGLHAAEMVEIPDEDSEAWEMADSFLSKANNSCETSLNINDDCLALFGFLRALSQPDLTLKLKQHSFFSERESKSQIRLFERLRALYNNPWWDRMWITQEAGVAPSLLLVYGKTKINFDHLANLAFGTRAWKSSMMKEFYPEAEKVLDGLTKKLLAISNLRYLHSKKFSVGVEDPSYRQVSLDSPLLWMLRSFRHRISRDPRDKIYALTQFLGSIPEKSEPVQARYDITSSTLYTEIFFRLIIETGVFWLTSMDLVAKLGDDLPSFVPDWSQSDVSANSFVRSWTIRTCYDTGRAIFFFKDSRREDTLSYISASDYYRHTDIDFSGYEIRTTDGQLAIREKDQFEQFEHEISGLLPSSGAEEPECLGVVKTIAPFQDDPQRSISLETYSTKFSQIMTVPCCLKICSEPLGTIVQISDKIHHNLGNIKTMLTEFEQLLHTEVSDISDAWPEAKGNWPTRNIATIKAVCFGVLFETTHNARRLRPIDDHFLLLFRMLIELPNTSYPEKVPLERLSWIGNYMDRIGSRIQTQDIQIRCSVCRMKEHIKPCPDCQKELASCPSLSPQEVWDQCRGVIEELLASVLETAPGHRLFLTDSGAVGLCSGNTEVFDQVHILSGAFCPFVIKADRGLQKLGAPAYRLKGDCYIDGMPMLNLDRATQIALV